MSGDESRPASLRVPLDRAPNPNGDRLNQGTNHIDVPIIIVPDLPVFGEAGYGYDCSRVIRLREWNEQVLLHEILHVVLDPVLVRGDPQDPQGHNVISRVEVALWETGWRRHEVPEG